MKIIIYLTIFCFILISGCSSKSNNGAEIVLLDVKEDFQLLSLLESKKLVDTEIREKFELGFIGKLLVIRSATTNIDLLKGNELSGLCYLVTYSAQTKFSTVAKKDAAIASMAAEYARSIESKVLSKVNNIQASLGGEDCIIGGA